MSKLSALILVPLLAAAALAQEARVDFTAKFEPAQAAPGARVTMVISASVHPEYHIYGAKQKIGAPELTLGAASTQALALAGGMQMPDGEIHLNPILPDEIEYRIYGTTTIRQGFTVPNGTAAGAAQITVDLTYVACTETMCDPPFTQAISASLAVVEGGGAEQDLGSQAQDKALPTSHTGDRQTIEVVLVPETARPGEVVTVEVHVEMAKGWHNYGSAQDPKLGEPINMAVQSPRLESLGAAEVPPGHLDEAMFELLQDKYYYLEGSFVVRQKVRVPEGAELGAVTVPVTVNYTACDDALCLDPEVARIGAVLTLEAGEPRTEFLMANETAVPTPTGTVQSGDENPNAMSLMLYLLGAIGAGLFALVMPCTYPMIPLTVSFFTKQSEKKGGQPVVLALTYGAGIVVSFIVLGGLLGGLMQKVAADPWLNLFFAAAFVVFAMSLFGLFNIKAPQFLMNSAGRAQALASKEGSIFGGVVGVFLMGLTLCITSFACTAPFLGTMIAAGVDSGGQGRLLVGMAVFGATMALPFVVLSLLPGKLPRSGAWMNSAKILFGFIELAAALKFFSNAEYVWNWLILPREIFLAVWAALFAVAGFYLLGQIRLKGESGEIGGGRLVSGSAVIVLAFYFALGATGYRLDNMVMNAFEPPYSNAIGGGGGEGAAAVESHAIVVDDFDSAVQVAKDTEKLLLINFTGLT